MSQVCLIDGSTTHNYEWGLIQSISRDFNLRGFADSDAAVAALVADPSCPEVDDDYANMLRKIITITEQHQNPDDETWNFTAHVEWTAYEPNFVDREYITGSVQLASGNTVLFSALDAVYDSTGDILDPSLVGSFRYWTGEGDEPVCGFTIRRLYGKGSITVAFLTTIYEYINRPNSQTWRGFGIGEVKIVAVDFSDEDPDYDHISFTFAARKTITNLTFRDYKNELITVPTLHGWQRVDVDQAFTVDADTGNVTWGAIYSVAVLHDRPYIDLNNII